MNISLRKHLTALSLLALSLPAYKAQATIYETAATGSYIAPSTWVGGMVPPVNITNDTVWIRQGHNISLDTNIKMMTPNARLRIDGQLSSLDSEWVSMDDAQFDGVGSAAIDSGYLHYTGPLVLQTNVSFRALSVTQLEILNYGGTVGEHLYVRGPLQLANGTNLQLGSNGTIHMAGGTLSYMGSGGATLNGYNVIYTSGGNTGPELTGINLRDMVVNISALGPALVLSQDLNINNGTLTLTQGTVTLNNFNLNIGSGGDMTADIGLIHSTSQSDITINSAAGLTGAMKFSASSRVRKLSLNTNGVLRLASDLKVTGSLELTMGRLDVQTHNLSLITGAGITGATKDNYVILGANGTLGQDIDAGMTKLYPVGRDTFYSPITIKANTVSSPGQLNVAVRNEILSGGTTGSNVSGIEKCVAHTWHLTGPVGGGTLDLDLSPAWKEGAEKNGFMRKMAQLRQYSGSGYDVGPTEVATTTAEGLYTITRKGIKALSDYAVFEGKGGGINDAGQATLVNIYPNPAKDQLHIELKNINTATADIYNATGQKMQSVRISNGDNQINISGLANGLYILRLQGEGVNLAQPFTKQ